MIKKPIPLGFLTFIILTCLIGNLAYQRYQIKKEAIQNETHNFLITAREKLKESLEQGISATKIISFFIQKDGSVRDFDSLAPQILKINKSVDILQLVPGGIIRYVYPLKGNENVFGYDILNDPARNKDAIKAIHEKDFHYAGPLELKQGGLGIVGRRPIFRDSTFWGFSAVVIKLPRLLKDAGIDSLGKSGYYFQLSRINPDTHKEEFFISYPHRVGSANSVSVKLPNGDWKLSALPVNTNKGYANIFWLTLLGLLISAMGGTIVYMLLKRPEKLAKLVKMRTEALQESEEKYRSLIEQASDGIVISDFDGIIMEVNKSICLMSGFNTEEMLGRHIDNFLPKEDIKGHPLRIEDLLKGKTLLYERRILKKDGTFMDVEVNSKMAFGNTLIGLVRDITERKKAEEELKKSNERFELIAKATNDAIWDYDIITNEIVGNDNLYNLYGLTSGKDKINYELFESRIHPGERDRIMKNAQKAMSEKALSITEEFRFKIAGGTYKHFYNRAYIKYDDVGEPVRMLGVMQDITGRIKDGQKLLKEKELSDSIINNLPAVFYISNREGKMLKWNRNFEIVTGYSGEEISMMHPLDFYDEEEKKLFTEKIKKVFISGKEAIEANFLLKNGQRIPYYFSGMKVDYEGEVCLMGFGLDFSDKAASDKRIKESEQKFRSLVEQAADGVAILSEGGTPLYISPSVERILGYKESEIMQQTVFELTHTEDISAMTKVFEQLMENPNLPIKGPISRMLHKDGDWRWLESTFTNLLLIPSINGIVENFRDVTEKLQTEKRIITEKDLSDSIINSLPGIFYLYDHEGSFIRWNKNFETVTGYGAEQIRKMHLLDFYDADQKPMVEERIRNEFQRKMPDVEFLLLTKDKKKIPFFYNSIAIEYEGLPSIAGMGFDLTERKKIEQELLISNQLLEQKAAELKTSYGELERFTYIVSHDLQEPLRMVTSFLKLLKQKFQEQLDETGEKYIYFAMDGAVRMKQLIMDLLEYSRTGTNKEIATDTDMNEVMTDVLIVLGNSVQEQQAVVEIGNLPVLPGTSKLQMFQLMQNLLSNALKYHSGKALVIKINAKEENEQWVFSIQDNGIGIDPKFSEKIFIIFQRLHSKEEYSGTGIGLSICKKIVEMNGGKIWVESSPGSGSTFYFSIPKKNEDWTRSAIGVT
ncbi:MAG: PAS domain S-box protein [Ferruginibacter sp.]